MSRSLAYEPTAHFFEPHEYYDPRELVLPVAELLTEFGRRPKLDTEGDALRLCGATELLCGLGITPTARFEVGVDQEPGQLFFEPFQTHNPDHLAEEVVRLLGQRSVRPMNCVYEGSLLRRRGASRLLRGYGIMPAFRTEDWFRMRDSNGHDCR